MCRTSAAVCTFVVPARRGAGIFFDFTVYSFRYRTPRGLRRLEYGF
jgi:hypothetical protein